VRTCGVAAKVGRTPEASSRTKGHDSFVSKLVSTPLVCGRKVQCKSPSLVAILIASSSWVDVWYLRDASAHTCIGALGELPSGGDETILVGPGNAPAVSKSCTPVLPLSLRENSVSRRGWMSATFARASVGDPAAIAAAGEIGPSVATGDSEAAAGDFRGDRADLESPKVSPVCRMAPVGL